MGGDFASVHIVGIGGMGMAPLAVLALRDGMLVSGSDMQAGKNTRMLEDLGITVHIGHSPLNVPQASRPSQCVLATTAAKDTNAEIQRARQLGIPVFSRQQWWPKVTQNRSVVAVAGSHGKTTISSMVTFVMHAMDMRVPFIVGSSIPQVPLSRMLSDHTPSAASAATPGTHDEPVQAESAQAQSVQAVSAAQFPEGLVVEADEYGGAFLGLGPAVAVISSIDLDHVDIYKSEADLDAAFEAFARRVLPGGTLLVCGDDAGCQRLVTSLTRDDPRWAQDGAQDTQSHSEQTPSFARQLPRGTVFEVPFSQEPEAEDNPYSNGLTPPAITYLVTYGFEPHNDIRISPCAPTPGNHNCADVFFGASKLASFCSQLPGRHNLQNGTAALLATALHVTTARAPLQLNTQPNAQPNTQLSTQPNVGARAGCLPPQSGTQPSMQVSTQPSTQPNTQPSAGARAGCLPPQLNTQPNKQPNTQPGLQPNTQPNTQPSTQPNRQPSAGARSACLPPQPNAQPNTHFSTQTNTQRNMQPSASSHSECLPPRPNSVPCASARSDQDAQSFAAARNRPVSTDLRQQSPNRASQFAVAASNAAAQLQHFCGVDRRLQLLGTFPSPTTSPSSLGTFCSPTTSSPSLGTLPSPTNSSTSLSTFPSPTNSPRSLGTLDPSPLASPASTLDRSPTNSPAILPAPPPPHQQAHGQVHVYDDYAHHPTEVDASIRAVRSRHPGARVLAVFQPHTLTRLEYFVDAFGEALAQADAVLLLPVFASREAEAVLQGHADSSGVGSGRDVRAAEPLLHALAASVTRCLRSEAVTRNLRSEAEVRPAGTHSGIAHTAAIVGAAPLLPALTESVSRCLRSEAEVGPAGTSSGVVGAGMATAVECAGSLGDAQQALLRVVAARCLGGLGSELLRGLKGDEECDTVLLVMGAGDVTRLAHGVARDLKEAVEIAVQ